MSDVRICERDGAPLVMTFEFPGAEYVCVEYGGTEGIFGLRAESTPDRLRALAAATERYETERAAREGRPAAVLIHVGDDGVQTPRCRTCEMDAEVGTLLVNGKPPGWFSKTVDIGRAHVQVFACSAACIPDGEARLPW